MEKENRILFIGDSITDCGRERPLSGRYSLGDGYVRLINSFLEMNHFKKNCRVFNTGISGNTVKDLEKRWETDVFAHSPEYLSVMIGVNDVWRQFDNPFGFSEHVSLIEFTQTLKGLIKSSKEKGMKIILMSPFMIELNEEDKFKSLLRTYINKVKETAEEFDTGYIDIQEVFDNHLKNSGCYSMFLSGDRVHPCLTGHMLIATAWMNYFESKYLGAK